MTKLVIKKEQDVKIWKHSKLNYLEYTKLEMMNYLKDPRIKPETARKIFKFRVHMLDFKQNYKGKYGPDNKCPLCENHIDSQDEIQNCKIMKSRFNTENELEKLNLIYEDKVDMHAANLLENILQIREEILNKTCEK